MGRPIARSPAGEIMSCTKAITPSRSPCEGLHCAATLGSKGIPEEHRDSLLEALHLKNIPLSRECMSKRLSGQQRSEGKQVSIGIPSFQALAPCSPSESFTSSKVSKLGFSSSSSSSSSSSYNEVGSSFVVEELSPASVTSAEVKEAECPPARRSFNRLSLTPRLAALAPSKKWDDTKMHCNCTSSPAQNPALKARIPYNFPLEDKLLEGPKARRQPSSKSRKDNLGFNSLDYIGCDKGDKIIKDNAGCGRNAMRPYIALKPPADVNADVSSGSSCTKSLHCVLEGALKFSSKEIDGKEGRDGVSTPAFSSESSDSALSYRKCSIMSNPPTDGANAALYGMQCIPSDIIENSYKHTRDYSTPNYNDLQYEIHTEDLLEGCNIASKLRKDCSTSCDTRSDSHLEGYESIELSMHVEADAQVIHKCALECSSTPYEADIGVDTLSLQPRAASLNLSEKINLSRAFSSHQHAHTNERIFSFQTPVTTKSKLDAQCSTPFPLFERGMAVKRSTDHCTSMDMVFGKRNKAPSGISDRGASIKEASIDFSDRKPSITQDLNRSYAIIHPQDHIQKDVKAILVPPVSKKYSYNEILRPSIVYGKLTEKADVFTLHSPIPLKELKYSEGSGASTLNPPIVRVTSKMHWDWRSKSMGAKASLKSAVRNLEATFTAGSRSVSLPKTRHWAQKDIRPESARLLERVFVSPMRARSKQVGFLKPIERPLFPSRQSNEAKDDEVFRRRDAKALTSNAQSHPATACTPGSFVSRPSPPSGYKEVEVTCKPFLPASRSVRCLPASRGALGIESLVSSGRKADGLSSHALDGAPPGMLHAQLQCILKDGLPFYTMTVEGSEEMLLARTCWQESHLSKEGCKWQYSFHSGYSKARGIGGSSGWRSWIKKESKTISDLRGIMQVSSTFRSEVALPTREVQLLKVLEFVLYDGRGAGVAHSQSLRLCSTEQLCQKSGLSRESPSFSYPSSEHVFSSSPSHLEMGTTKKQHVRSLTNLTVSSQSTNTSSSLHKGSGGHRPSLSLDVWSDSDVPDSTQELATQGPSSCSPPHVELAALVIQVSPEGHQRDSNVSEGDDIGKNSKGWGLKFLDGDIGSELRSGLSHVHTAKDMNFHRAASGQAGLGTSAEFKPRPIGNRSGHQCPRINRGGLPNENSSVIEEFQDSSMAERFVRQGSSGSVTLLLPSGDHGFPNGGTRGPSSLIERWRSGGSCECGGWDLGCGIKVISSGSPTKKCMISNKHTKTSVSYDQQFSLFSQGSKQELMLGLLLIKQGEFKLSFQGQLSPLKAFAAAVAMLHSHEPTLLPLSSLASSLITSSSLMPSTFSSSSLSMSSSLLSSSSSSLLSSSSLSIFPLSSPSSLLSSSSSLMSSSAIEAGMMINNLKERPPRPPQIPLVAPRRSDSSSKDEVSPFLVHNQTFSN